MFALFAMLWAATTTLAMAGPALSQRAGPICYNGYGNVTVLIPGTNTVLGTLGASLLDGRVITTQSPYSPTALSANISCPGLQSVFALNANPSKYPVIAAAAIYNTTMSPGSPNWAILTTSPRTGGYPGAVNLGNAWTDANNIPAPTESNIFTFQAANNSATGNLTLSWTNPDYSTVPLYAFSSDGGLLLGVTANLSAFEAVMGYNNETPSTTYTPVIFQMRAFPYY